MHMKKLFNVIKEHKKKILKYLFLLIIIIILIVGAIFITTKAIENMRAKNINDKNWLRKNVNIVNDGYMGDDIMYIKTKDYVSIFKQNYQDIIEEKINALLEKNEYTFEHPLIIYNAYGTNTLSVNVYFNGEDNEDISYTVSTESDGIADFQRTLISKENKAYQIIGLVPGCENKITLETTENEEKITSQFKIDLSNIEILSETILSSEEGTSKNELASGLYTLLGNDSDDKDYVSIYDNNGVIRGEMPIIGYRAHALLFNNNKMYLSISQTKIAEINNLGKITNIYKTGKYYLHHDYTFDDEGNLLVLANNTEKDTEEDCIIKIDLKTHKVTEVIDFEKMLKSYAEMCVNDTESFRDEGEDGIDWLHLNSIEYIDGDVILSSRETSSIIKVNNIESNPQLAYILADESIWEDTEFEEYLYKKVGDFKIHAGQHSVRYVKGEGDGIYYLVFFNNNYGKMTSRPQFSYANIGITNDNAFAGDNSYYYVYKVDENKQTFELVDNFAVDYSGIVSSVQTLDNENILIDSGTKGVFAEYDKDHNLIKKYTAKLNKYMVYRVLKYDFSNYWFK